MKPLAVFAVMVVLDVVWAKYIRATAEKRRWPAASMAGLLVLLGGFNTLAFVDDPRMILPAALGAFAGTWVACR